MELLIEKSFRYENLVIQKFPPIARNVAFHPKHADFFKDFDCL